jgi:shikimate dehydrogenase
MPLKAQVVHHLSELNGEAERLGAVNCVVPRGREGLWGTNFDSTAVMELMAPLQWEGHATLLGSGGAARAALWALPFAGFERITVQARNPAKAREMIESLQVTAEAALLGSPVQGQTLINATPLGMAGYPPLDISLDAMADGSSVLDMVYDPVGTPLLEEARRRAFRTIDGLEMLMEQAAMSFVTFFNAAPDQQLRDELREFLTS